MSTVQVNRHIFWIIIFWLVLYSFLIQFKAHNIPVNEVSASWYDYLFLLVIFNIVILSFFFLRRYLLTYWSFFLILCLFHLNIKLVSKRYSHCMKAFPDFGFGRDHLAEYILIGRSPRRSCWRWIHSYFKTSWIIRHTG